MKFKFFDSAFTNDSYMSDEEEGFKMEARDTSIRFIPYENAIWNCVTYEMSLTRHEYTRVVYNITDFLSNVGGLVSALMPFCIMIVSAFHYKDVYPFIMRDS